MLSGIAKSSGTLVIQLCCCNGLHRQMVPMASEHADPPPHTHTLIHILKVCLKAILSQTPPPSHMRTLIYTQYKSVCNQAGQA